MFFFFCTACWLSLDFSLSSLFPLEAKSSLTVRNDKPKVADCVWFHCLRVQQTIISLFLVQPGKKYNLFFSSFCHLFGACAQWKHSPLSVAYIVSFFCFVFLSLFHIDSLRVSCASVQSFWRQCSDDSYQSCYLKETEKQVSGEKKNGDRGTTTLCKGNHQQLI